MSDRQTFIETIRFEKGEFHLLSLHQKRMAATIREIYGAGVQVPNLRAALPQPEGMPDSEILKCRVTYDTEIHKVETLPYTPRMVRSLKIVESPSDLDYHLKKSDRTLLDRLSSEKQYCDEVLIIRNGLITDTSYSNVVFKGAAGLYTPDTPLLHGVMRQHLLNKGIIRERDIRLSDIVPGNPLGITEVLLINAMLPLYAVPAIPVSAIL